MVLDAEYFAIYKDTLVVKVPFMKDNGFSFGVIFLGSAVTKENTLRHEYGHFVHLKLIGPIRYFMFVVAPSVTIFTLQGTYPPERYYSYRWECIADLLGGVDRSFDYYPGAVQNALEYFEFTLP